MAKVSSSDDYMLYENLVYGDPYSDNSGIDLTGGSSDSGPGFGGMYTGVKGITELGAAYGTYLAGKQTKAADEYNAQLVREAGYFDQLKLGKEEVGLESTQRAMYAKAGVTQSGSPLDTALQSAAGFELDKQISRYNTESKANMLEWEGKMAQQKAKTQATMQAIEGVGMLALMLL